MKASVKLALFIVLSLGITFNSAYSKCVKGNGRMQEVIKNLDKVEGIVVNCTAEVFIVQNQEQQAKIQIDSNLIDALDIKIEKKTLYINAKEEICPNRMKVYFPFQNLTKIELNKGGRVSANEPIKLDELSIKVNTTGQVVMSSIDIQKINTKIEGSGLIEFKGKAKECSAVVEGSGNITLSGLQTTESYAKIKGSGNIRIAATESLEAIIEGSGNIYYRGEPKNKKTKIEGSGKVIKLDK